MEQNMKRVISLLAAAAMSSTLAVKTAAAEEIVTAVHAFPSFLVYTKTFLEYVDTVNARGKGVVQIKVKGGPEAIKMFEQPKAVRDGVVDMVHTPGSFYGAEVPEIDAMVASTNTAEVTRKNGGTAILDAAHQKRFNVKFLGWVDSGVGFNIFTVKEPKFRSSDSVLDLGGVKIRDTPIYTAFLKSLEATTSPMPSTEAYGALEKGVIDAVPWTTIGLTDLKWDKFVKYMVQPSFYSTDLGIIVNMDRWNALSDEAKKVLQDVAIELEIKSTADRAADKAVYLKAYTDGGMKLVSHSDAGSSAYLKLAYDSVWARLEGRLADKGGAENGPKLRALFAPN
ncbi:MAG: C4-dicarboxylate ABC transporter substrate-binding protein [Bacteroidetes bacterium]|nr:C4-dicarboxylate ABC transporter substrate-binding protein [Bacteroidota bacterium]